MCRVHPMPKQLVPNLRQFDSMAARKTRENSSASVRYSSSSSSSSASSKQNRKFPSRALNWKIDYLLALGVCYEEDAIDLKKYMSVLKDRKDIEFHGLSKLPEIRQSLFRYTDEAWKFSFDFDKEHGQGIPEGIQQTQNAMKEFEDDKDVIEKRLQSEIMQEDKNSTKTGTQPSEDWKSLFYQWRTNLIDFWTYFSMILVRWWKPRQRKGRFKHLFMAFSKVCFLYPEPGEMYAESICIKGVDVHGVPDVRFVTLPTTTPPTLGSFLQLIVVTEVKQYNTFRGSYSAENFTYKNVSPDVLGQHGIQLLMERSSSFFRPVVVGFLCIGTKVIFTYLDIDQDHFEMILEKGEAVNTNKALISYTRPFDFMDADDRHEILELFFWFGFVQSNAYRN